MERQVQIREKCEDCDGGYVENPAVAEWRSKELTEIGDQPVWEVGQEEQRQDWWVRYDAWLADNPLPPDMFVCGECEGNVWIHKWIDMNELVDPEAPARWSPIPYQKGSEEYRAELGRRITAGMNRTRKSGGKVGRPPKPKSPVAAGSAS